MLVDSVRSAAQSCLTLCDPRDCSTPGFPVHHQLPEFTQIHVLEMPLDSLTDTTRALLLQEWIIIHLEMVGWHH